MASTILRFFHLPVDVASFLDEQADATDYLIAAVREKKSREDEERFRASARRITSLSPRERDVDFAQMAQFEVIRKT